MVSIFAVALLAYCAQAVGDQWRGSASDFFTPHDHSHSHTGPKQPTFSPQFKFASPPQTHQHKEAFVFEEAKRGAADTLQIFTPLSSQISNPAFPNHAPATFYCPQGVRVRKEFRDMTHEEWSRYKAVVRKMYEPDHTGLSKVDRFTKIHLDNAAIAHNTAHFLPWHRWFTFLYEEELRKFDPQVTIPYWDWTFDAQRPLASPIFSPYYLGTKTGRSGDCDWIVSFPRKHCLVRNYTPNDHRRFGTFYGRRTIDRLITDSRMSWSEFANLFETSPHGIVHYKIGGPGGDLSDMASPNDPMFFIHHSMVDYVWMQRQQFSGKMNAFGGSHRGRRATSGDELHPFRVTVEETFDFEKLCYTYQPFSGWLTAAPAALSAGANIPETDQSLHNHKLPDALSDSWIEMHGWDRQWVDQLEKRLQALESTPLGEQVPDKNSWSDWFKGASSNSASSLSVYPLVMIAVGVFAGLLVSFAL